MSPVRSQVRAHACVSSSIPSWGTYEMQWIQISLAHRCFSPSLSPSLPLFLKNKLNHFKNPLNLVIKNYMLFLLPQITRSQTALPRPSVPFILFLCTPSVMTLFLIFHCYMAEASGQEGHGSDIPSRAEVDIADTLGRTQVKEMGRNQVTQMAPGVQKHINR